MPLYKAKAVPTWKTLIFTESFVFCHLFSVASEQPALFYKTTPIKKWLNLAFSEYLLRARNSVTVLQHIIDISAAKYWRLPQIKQNTLKIRLILKKNAKIDKKVKLYTKKEAHFRELLTHMNIWFLIDFLR